MTEENKSLALVKGVDDLIPPKNVLEAYKTQADYMQANGFLPEGYRNGVDALNVALRGREMGVPFWQAIQGMFPMKGRVGYMGGFLLARVKAFYPESEVLIEESTPTICKLKARKNKVDDYFLEEFTFSEADQMNYNKNWDKEAKAWKLKPTWKVPTNMLYWRCVTRMINRHFSEVFGAPVYQRDELEDSEGETWTTTGKPSEVPYETQTPTTPSESKSASSESIEDAVIVESSSSTTAKQPPPPFETEETGSPSSAPATGEKTEQQITDDLIAGLKDCETISQVQETWDKFKKNNPGKGVLTAKLFTVMARRKQEVREKK